MLGIIEYSEKYYYDLVFCMEKLQDFIVEKDLLTIDTLAKDSPNAHRNIDTVYYVSLCLNKGEKVNINDINLKKYLYINVLHHNSINIIPSDFLDGIEERLKNNENFQRTKCIQNELFYRENKDYVKQNKKCAIINNEPYIYNNVNLERAY